VTVELKQDDIGLLISLLTQEIDRVGEVEEKYGFCDLSHFFRMVDTRTKLLDMPVDGELQAGFSDKEWE